jgi:hypothetical protein
MIQTGEGVIKRLTKRVESTVEFRESGVSKVQNVCKLQGEIISGPAW